MKKSRLTLLIPLLLSGCSFPGELVPGKTSSRTTTPTNVPTSEPTSVPTTSTPTSGPTTSVPASTSTPTSTSNPISESSSEPTTTSSIPTSQSTSNSTSIPTSISTSVSTSTSVEPDPDPNAIDLNDTSEVEIRNYYSNLNILAENERKGTNLLKNLKPILKNNQVCYSYGSSASTKVWQIYEIIDRDWVRSPASQIDGYNPTSNKINYYQYGQSNSNPGSNPYVHALYINRNVVNQTKAWGNHNQDQWGINQEHVWPKSLGFDDSSNPIGARGDLMHLMAGNGYSNRIHSNYYYGYVDRTISYTDIGTTYSNQSGNLKGTSKTLGVGTVFEPQDSDKGDIARAVFYMMARYNNLAGEGGTSSAEPNLELVNDTSSYSSSGYTSSESITGKLGIVQDLLEWNRLDPVDEYEIHRNNLLYNNYSHNRNPFIDFPEWAEAIWGTSTNGSYNSTPFGVANPNDDLVNNRESSSGGSHTPTTSQSTSVPTSTSIPTPTSILTSIPTSTTTTTSNTLIEFDDREILPCGYVKMDAPTNYPVTINTTYDSSDWFEAGFTDDFPNDDWTYIYGNACNKWPSPHYASTTKAFYSYNESNVKQYPGGLKMDQKSKGFQTPLFTHEGEKLEIRISISQVNNNNDKAQKGEPTAYLYFYNQDSDLIKTINIEEGSIKTQTAGSYIRYYVTGNNVQDIAYLEFRLNQMPYVSSQCYNFGIGGISIHSWPQA